MGYHFSIHTVRLDVGRRFHFFGDETVLSVVIRPDLGGHQKVIHTGTRTMLQHGVPLRTEPLSSLDAPTPTAGRWVNEHGVPVPSWGYTVVVTATASGRSPVIWRRTITVPSQARTVNLDPSTGGQLTAAPYVPAGSTVDPLTGGTPNGGGGGTVNVFEDPDVPGTALIGA